MENPEDQVFWVEVTASEGARSSEYRKLLGLVMCADSECAALITPRNFEEYKIAYFHWRNHSLHGGCSHGN